MKVSKMIMRILSLYFHDNSEKFVQLPLRKDSAMGRNVWPQTNVLHIIGPFVLVSSLTLSQLTGGCMTKLSRMPVFHFTEKFPGQFQQKFIKFNTRLIQFLKINIPNQIFEIQKKQFNFKHSP